MKYKCSWQSRTREEKSACNFNPNYGWLLQIQQLLDVNGVQQATITQSYFIHTYFSWIEKQVLTTLVNCSQHLIPDGIHQHAVDSRGNVDIIKCVTEGHRFGGFGGAQTVQPSVTRWTKYNCYQGGPTVIVYSVPSYLKH